MKTAYTEKQMEAYNLLHDVGKDGVSSEAINEIMNMLEDQQALSTKPVFLNEESIDAIKMKLLDETDWRKRAILSARLISKGLE